MADIDSESICPVCFEEFEEQKFFLQSQVCNHRFCAPCVVQWLKDSHNHDCPLCRCDFPEELAQWTIIPTGAESESNVVLVRELLGETEKLRDELKGVMNENQIMAAECHDLEAENKRLKKLVDVDISEEFKSVMNENGQLAVECVALEKENKRLNEVLQAKEDEIQELKRNLRQLNQNIDEQNKASWWTFFY